MNSLPQQAPGPTFTKVTLAGGRQVLMLAMTVATGLVAATSTWRVAQAAPVMPAGNRAMWVWGRPAADQVIRWAISHSVGDLYVSVTADVTPDGFARLVDLKRRATAKGLRLSALGGSPAWIQNPAAALAWQHAVEGTVLFTAAHLDIEPYATREWNSDRTTAARAYLALLDRMTVAARLKLEVDAPFWYGGIIIDGRNLADEVFRRVNAMTVMAYRNTVIGRNSVMAVGADMLSRAARLHKAIRIGVETDALATCAYCTFYPGSQGEVENSLRALDVAARRYPTYAGVAVNHFLSWKALPA
jgi:hypothetical protein